MNQARQAQCRIVRWHLGYDSQIDEAEAEIARLLDDGWTIAGTGGSTNAAFALLVRFADPKPEPIQVNAPSTPQVRRVVMDLRRN